MNDGLLVTNMTETVNNGQTYEVLDGSDGDLVF
jgi:hypothetical protein